LPNGIRLREIKGFTRSWQLLQKHSNKPSTLDMFCTVYLVTKEQGFFIWLKGLTIVTAVEITVIDCFYTRGCIVCPEGWCLSVQKDNVSWTFLLLRTQYPSERTWANICGLSGYASSIKTGTRHIHLDELSFEMGLEQCAGMHNKSCACHYTRDT